MKGPLVRQDDAAVGPADAPVTILVFGEYEHFFLAKVAPELLALQAQHPNDVRLVFRHAPTTPEGRGLRSAHVARAVLESSGPEVFFRFHASLLEKQSVFDFLGDDVLVATAFTTGARDTAKLLARASSPEIAARVAIDVEAFKQLETGPNVVTIINGRQVVGGDLPKLRATFEQALATARSTRGPRSAISCRAAVSTMSSQPAPYVAPTPDPPTGPWKVPLGDQPRLGSKTPLVTMVWFGDMQDRFNRRALAVMKPLLAEFGDDLAIVWRDFPLPFHERAVPATNAARAIRKQKGDAAFFQAVEEFLGAVATDDVIAGVAKKLGADPDLALAGSRLPSDLADQLLAADVGATGTPYFLINGMAISGVQPIARFRALIETERGKAKALVAAGTPREKVHDVATKDGKLSQLERKPPPKVPRAAPSRGDPKAPMVLQVWGGFEDPFTKRAQPLLREIQARYGTDLRIVFRHRPLAFHQRAMATAEASLEAKAQAGDAGFFAFHDEILAHQGEEGALSDDAIEGYAKKIGLDLVRFRKAMADHRHKAAIDAEQKEADAFDITGTPTFFVGEYRVLGVKSNELWRALNATAGRLR